MIFKEDSYLLRSKKKIYTPKEGVWISELIENYAPNL